VSETLLPGASMVIPLPSEVQPGEGRFAVGGDTVIAAPPALEKIAGFLQHTIRRESALSLKIVPEARENALRLQLDPALPGAGAEGYRLTVDLSGVTIRAKTEAGLFYGAQTLRQMLPPAERGGGDKTAVIPCLEIDDRPRFQWRGFMLDVARHFSSVAAVKQLIDALALLKMNVLHLHLCDDQGWRMEIERYPRLVEVGASRPETQVGGVLGRKKDGIPHSGYFTKDNLREIIAYAGARFITVVPEIEMPGHCRAALAAYPGLGCTGGPYSVSTTAGIKKDIYCAGQEAVFSFLQGVLDEVIALFPSPWIHIGGDEAPKNRWRACPRCQERIAAEGLRDERELQAYFIRRMARYIEEKGRRVIGWNEILSGDLPPSVTVQHWLGGKKGVRRHLRRGGRIIGSYFFYSYLDYNHGFLPLSKVYAYDPVPRGLEPRYRKNVIGIETPLWTETASTLQRRQAFVFPRLVAAAENNWTAPGPQRHFQGFLARLPLLLGRLRRLGISHTGVQAAQPAPLKRLFLWAKMPRQSGIMPEGVEKGDPSP
jgi:hexosaminidase